METESVEYFSDKMYDNCFRAINVTNKEFVRHDEQRL